MKFKVWHVPQVPMPSFVVECDSLEEAHKIQTVLADYDLFQFNHRVKPDYSNASGIQELDEETQEWDELDDYEVEERLEKS